MNYFTNLWLKIPETWRAEIVSASHTFMGAMIAEVALQISTTGGIIPTSQEAWLALATMAVRAGWKALMIFLSAQAKTDQP